MAAQVQKQPPSQKVWGAKAPASEKEKKIERKIGTFERVEKKKEKPKTAPAGGGMKPPSKPPKGPTGGDNKRPKDEGKRQYGEDKHNPSMGKGKGTPASKPDKNKDAGLRKEENKHNSSLGKFNRK
jgi:hypothetical protein